MSRRSFYPLPYLLTTSGPGLAWIALFVVLGVYSLFAISLGTPDPILLTPTPAWSPLDWSFANFRDVISGLNPSGGIFWEVFRRSFVYIVLAAAGCVLIGYPVAYYVAMYAKRSKALLLVLLILPFLVSYMLRMLAWVGLLAPDGYVNEALSRLHLVSQPQDWLGGRPSTVVLALIYGWVPYFILPLYAALERLDRRYLEASADLGAGRVRTFIFTTLPLSVPGILAGLVLIALPMFGDYYTNQLVSGAATTSMIGNTINTYIASTQQRAIGAALAATLLIFLIAVLAYYVRTTARAARAVVR
ncbi:MAG: ABC transporter permease [Solirubrobacteraceae bacterium]|nr:ABC transporter permease [Solirubrobacteraceae bacterium]